MFDTHARSKKPTIQLSMHAVASIVIGMKDTGNLNFPEKENDYFFSFLSQKRHFKVVKKLLITTAMGQNDICIRFEYRL